MKYENKVTQQSRGLTFFKGFNAGILHVQHDFSKCHYYLLLYEITPKNLVREMSLLLKKCRNPCFSPSCHLYRAATFLPSSPCPAQGSAWERDPGGVLAIAVQPMVGSPSHSVSSCPFHMGGPLGTPWSHFQGCGCRAFRIHSFVR